MAARARAVFPEECRGLISGVKTRRGVEAVALHDIEGPDGGAEAYRGFPMITERFRDRLIELLEEAGTPVVSFYRTRSRCAMSDDDEPFTLNGEQATWREVEHLVLDVRDGRLKDARVFSWDGRSFKGRELVLEE